MQLFAYNANQQIVHARQAGKGRDYRCLECGAPVRLRGGLYRQRHFYHLAQQRGCRLSGKTAEHLQVQRYIQKCLPEGACILERPFPAINRIADAAWEEEKIVFEVQCSPISAEEVAARNSDYLKAGYQVIWILHDNRYNQRRETEAERFLRRHPHYYADIDARGRGKVYDILRLPGRGRRFIGPLPVDPSCPLAPPTPHRKASFSLKKRAVDWPICLKGDLLAKSPSLHPTPDLPTKRWRALVLAPYRVLFQILLERYAK